MRVEKLSMFVMRSPTTMSSPPPPLTVSSPPCPMTRSSPSPPFNLSAPGDSKLRASKELIQYVLLFKSFSSSFVGSVLKAPIAITAELLNIIYMSLSVLDANSSPSIRILRLFVTAKVVFTIPAMVPTSSNTTFLCHLPSISCRGTPFSSTARSMVPRSPRIMSLPAPPWMVSSPKSPISSSSPSPPSILSFPRWPKIISAPPSPERSSLPWTPSISWYNVISRMTSANGAGCFCQSKLLYFGSDLSDRNRLM
mmetsp:Transcript_9965/g.18978  ORF Transcript_9965/g.18978 Transcript_9965/m.18978 type:complete len:253 (-) Transcript_9965:1497-2255(-)